MQVEIGPGIEDFSYQDVFESSTNCIHCKCTKKAELIFVAHEMHEEKGSHFICQNHANLPDKEGLWPHDAMCVANYLCRSCFEITAIWNQA